MKLSIIIPVYNGIHKLIKHALPSIYKQKELETLDYEVIVVDDCSTEGKYEWLENKCKNLKVIKTDKNVGDALARKRGIECASGEWLIFIDSDDELIDGALSVFDREIPDNVNIITCDVIADCGEIVYVKNLLNRHESVCTHAKLWRRSFILEDKNLFTHPKLRVTGDSFFTTVSLHITRKKYGDSSIMNVRIPFYKFNLRDSGTVTSGVNHYLYNGVARLLSYIDMTSIYKDELGEEGVKELLVEYYTMVISQVREIDTSKINIEERRMVYDSCNMWFDYVFRKFKIIKFNDFRDFINEYCIYGSFSTGSLREQYNRWIHERFVERRAIPDYRKDPRVFNA